MSARKFGDNIDLQGNQIFNLRIEILAAAPGTPITGRPYYNSTNNSLNYWNGTAWVCLDPALLSNYIPLTALANIAAATLLGNNTGGAGAPLALTGTQVKTLLAIVYTDISNFATGVQLNRLDQMAAPAAAVNANSQKVTNLATPTTGTDAANKSYVDAQAQSSASGIDPKESCRVASTANITTLSGLLTVDGVTVAAGDRVLVKNQTTASANGIYVAASGAWARPADGVQGELTSGALVFVELGTAQAATQWYLQTADPITIGTTSLTWTQFGAGAAYTAGTNGGLQLVGNAFSVNPTSGGGIVADSTGLHVDVAVVAQKQSVTIGDGTSLAYVVTHNLNTQDVVVGIRDVATPFASDDTTWEATSVNTITVRFATAPASNSIRVTVIG